MQGRYDFKMFNVVGDISS